MILWIAIIVAVVYVIAKFVTNMGRSEHHSEAEELRRELRELRREIERLREEKKQ
ncbi:hypothetical protein [Hyperthermus butylicus]|uniref:hypothetical protein n=1 Tax=Hyperthermus butylicus TaxID=54248 RepID=UPI00129BFA12|nr:hypothetical protein [Hyperthermus butylicus]